MSFDKVWQESRSCCPSPWRARSSQAQTDSARADSLFAVADWRAAATAYATIVRRDASDGRAWFRMGFAQHQSGDYARAIEALQRANDRGFAPPRVCYRLAQARSGDTAAALDWLHRAIDAGFTNGPRQMGADGSTAAAGSSTSKAS